MTNIVVKITKVDESDEREGSLTYFQPRTV